MSDEELDLDVTEDEDQDAKVPEGETQSAGHQGESRVDSRRRLEDRLEEMRLRKQTLDYDFD